MRKLPVSQVHLDFHTSPLIPGVGDAFDKKQFQEALRIGNVKSVTVFAKCHHGYCYFPSKVGVQHPGMRPGFDLTGAMVDAAHEIGVDAPIYVTVGWSAKDADEHPEWCMREKDRSIRTNNANLNALPDDPRPNCSWVCLCPSGDYAGEIYKLTEEITNRYKRVDGIFFDIVYLKDTCYCENCLKGMREAGLDPEREEDVKAYYVKSHLEFMDNCTKIMRKRHPEATVFFNSGGADIYRPEYHDGQSHYEMEDLPNAWHGYNKMPARASVMSRYGKEYVGETGKFHTSWGEFGGYKNPAALKYEAYSMAMYGAKCSIGDQMPPSGRMDIETYRLMSGAFKALDEIAPWAYPSHSTATLGIYLCKSKDSDDGLHSMLLESHIDFEVVMPGDDLGRYGALILPDGVALTDREAERIREYIQTGGAVLFTNMSAVKDGRFLIDAGIDFIGAPSYRQDYFFAGEELNLSYGNAPFICYEAAARVKIRDAKPIADVYEPWFDRTYKAYCSHMNTPYRNEKALHPAASKKGKVIYLAHPLCRLYKKYGMQLFRDVLIHALSLIYKPVYSLNIPSAGRTRLTVQPEKDRYVFHVSYASPIQRGSAAVIEDIVPLYNVEIALDIAGKVEKVLLAPSGEELHYEWNDGKLKFVIPQVNMYQAVEIRVAPGTYK